MKIITPSQCRAARALLNWGQPELGQRCSIHKQTISNFESERSTPSKGTLEKIIDVFELAGVEFIKGGARERDHVTTLTGRDGFSAFLDDVYQTATQNGSKKTPCEIYLSNVIHDNWIKWMGAEKWKKHIKRMTDNKDIMDVRIIVKEGDNNFPAESYSQYKWFPAPLFNDKSFYSYHDKLAFLNFEKDDVKITIMRQFEFAEGYRTLFEIAWNQAKTPPKFS